MRNIIRIITIVLFVIAAFPISTCIRKSTEKDIEQFKEARKVSGEAEFAEALNTDGWIYAKGAIEGKAPLYKLEEGKKSIDFDLNALTREKIDPERIIYKLRGDFLSLHLVIGKVERENINDPLKIEEFYSAATEVESVTFLGQTFNAKKILSKIPEKTILQYPERRNSLYGYEVKGKRSPFPTWMKLLIKNGQIVEEELQLHHDDYVQKMIKAVETGDSSKMQKSSVIGFVVVWAILLLLLLWLEGKWFRKKKTTKQQKR